MEDEFDPYYEWLGIPRRDQPPNWYRLLGIELFEPNQNVIERAADRQMGHLRTFQTGPRSADSQRLLNEVSAARIGLLSTDRKSKYDAQLREAVQGPRREVPDPPHHIPPPPPPAATRVSPPPPPRGRHNDEPPRPSLPEAVDGAARVRRIPRLRRVRRRRVSAWRQPATWAVLLLLLAFVALIVLGGMLVLREPDRGMLPGPPADRTGGAPR